MAAVPEGETSFLLLAVSPIGSDIWTSTEKRLFKKAFCAHKKDFYLIHKTVRRTWQAGVDKAPSHGRGAKTAGPVRGDTLLML